MSSSIEPRGLSARGRRDLATLFGAGRRTVTVDAAAAALGVSRESAARRLSAWASNGWLRRVRRGLYIAVPVDVRDPATWNEDPYHSRLNPTNFTPVAESATVDTTPTSVSQPLPEPLKWPNPAPAGVRHDPSARTDDRITALLERPEMIERLQRDASEHIEAPADPTPGTAAVRLACLAMRQAGLWVTRSWRSRLTTPASLRQSRLPPRPQTGAKPSRAATAILEGPEAAEALGLTA